MPRVIPALLLLAASLLVTQVQATTFKIATLAPDGTSWMNEMRAAAKTIQQRTDGRVAFRFYPGGIMGNDKSVLRKMRVGQLHGGALTGGGLADILPEAQVYSLPFEFRDFAEVDYVRQQMDPLLMERLKSSGYIGFGISEGGFAYLMSDAPIAGIEDLKGHKIWVPEGDLISRSAFEATGTSPISLPLTDVLTGLQTGLVDTVATTPTGAIALQWHTRVRYLTDTPLMYIYGTLVLQQRAFEKLSKADQQVVHEVMGGTFKRLNRQNREDNQSARTALRGQGIEFVQSDAIALQQWRGVIGMAMEELVEDKLFDAAIYRQLQQHLQTYRSRH
ncbi:MAG: TRAP transporter substrate-binding protein DctP [Gammaproteobacteria bacterium]|nr:TRAP transporter substrate-binding protein DctP [Gammaproteobacteria bacterium]MCW8928100.1 TRAP transporter substrate-binding protein DctP [Gammaproteobacteria bacterium]MCW8959851.1 TRAP transporter substrate-binding protein DctP [Gammaproteobacteria bacterium]MCW8973033.1 TRAP transporter substrate-binding protein DctP [Gammaproteobacteria bacterium]MCW8994031.1 TRAP transporter substrate-binding protein DctP [Gammaproteobacteria bacterium]